MKKHLKVAIILGVAVVWGVQPLMIMGGLVILVFGYCLYLYFMMGSFWLSYLLVLVMLSGILVVFSYMLSMIPNSEFESMNFYYILPLFCFFWSKWVFLSGEDFSILSSELWGGVGVLTLYMTLFLFSIMVMVVWLSKGGLGSFK